MEFSRIEEEDRRSAEKEAEAKRAAGRSLRGSLVGVSQLAGVLHLHNPTPAAAKQPRTPRNFRLGASLNLRIEWSVLFLYLRMFWPLLLA